MKEGVEQIVRLALSGDETIPRDNIERAMEIIKNGVKATDEVQMDSVLSRQEVQHIFGFKSPKSVDQHAARGVFRRIYLPSCRRAVGYSKTSVMDALRHHEAY